MKLDPEDQIIAAALDRAILEEANERMVASRIEFPREGHAKLSMIISRKLVDKARALDWSTGKLVAEAIRIALPGVLDGDTRRKAPSRAA